MDATLTHPAEFGGGGRKLGVADLPVMDEMKATALKIPVPENKIFSSIYYQINKLKHHFKHIYSKNTWKSHHSLNRSVNIYNEGRLYTK